MATDPGVTVRPGRIEDLAEVARLYGPGGETPWDPFIDAARLERIPLDGLLIAEKDGSYAGFLYWFEGRKPWFDKGADQYAQLEELHVRPEFQGWGVAQRLIERFLREVAARGIPLLYVATDETNTAAQHIYQEAGFQPFLRTIHYRKYT
ncbi:MAG TPA: GNAT family N-acetyltransferase [Thermoplasmata archaeon]|nr:GNAT family N-acetyltransferase [Thermoplasmata archaeon]